MCLHERSHFKDNFHRGTLNTHFLPEPKSPSHQQCPWKVSWQRNSNVKPTIVLCRILTTTASLQHFFHTCSLVPCRCFCCTLRPNLCHTFFTWSLTRQVAQDIPHQSHFIRFFPTIRQTCYQIDFLKNAPLYLDGRGLSTPPAAEKAFAHMPSHITINTCALCLILTHRITQICKLWMPFVFEN